MGRARKVTGPFLDNMGVDMIQGGGKLFLGSGGRYVGPGHFGLLDLGDGVLCCEFHSKMNAIGGDTTGGGFFDFSNLVDELDISAWPAGSWAASPPLLPSARQANQAGFYGGTPARIWSTGGYNGTALAEHLYRQYDVVCASPTPTATATFTPTPTATASATATPTATAGTPTPTPTCGPAAWQSGAGWGSPRAGDRRSRQGVRRVGRLPFPNGLP